MLSRVLQSLAVGISQNHLKPLGLPEYCAASHAAPKVFVHLRLRDFRAGKTTFHEYIKTSHKQSEQKMQR